MKETVEIEVNPLEFSDGERLKRIAAKKAGINPEDVACLRLLRKSLDARKNPVYRLRFLVSTDYEEERPIERNYRDVSNAESVIIVGAGPCGLFAALTLLECGLKPVIVERGRSVSERKKDIAMIARNVSFNEDSNWCFGEGGAGTFSDGKLYTRSNKKGSIEQVLETFVRHGADRSILTEAHPHIGTDRLSGIIKNIRHTITSCGGEYHFNSRVTAIERLPGGGFEAHTADGGSYSAARLILATGHSARDVYELLHRMGGALEAKGFALGVRVEHLQEKINWNQYHGQWKPGMPAAEYSFVEQVDGRGVFSFCMCPGGILVPSSTEAGTVVLNGMSNSARSGKFANAGVVVQVEPEDVPGGDPFRLMDFQRSVERSMYDFSFSAGARNPMAAPAQRMEDFCNGRMSKTLPETTYRPGAVSAPLHELLPPMVAGRLRRLFPRVKMRSYYTNAALLLGVESRTSSPVRIPRDPETLQYVSLPGLFPCGEGAGYAGGIVSSALDGINVASAVASSL